MRKFSGQLFFKTVSLITSRSSRPEAFWWSLLDEFDQLWELLFNFSIWLLIKFSFQFTWEFNPRFIRVIFLKRLIWAHITLVLQTNRLTKCARHLQTFSPTSHFVPYLSLSLSLSLSLFLKLFIVLT